MMALMMCLFLPFSIFARKTRSDKGGHHKSDNSYFSNSSSNKVFTLPDSTNYVDISNNGYDFYITSNINKKIIYEVNGRVDSIRMSNIIFEKSILYGNLSKDTINIDSKDIKWYNIYIKFKIISIDGKEPGSISSSSLEIETKNSNKVRYLIWTSILAVLIISVVISKVRKSKKNKLKIIEENTWASPEGIEFSEKLVKMIHNNESCKISNHEELKDLSVINQESINKKFDVKPGKRVSRIWLLLLMLNDRYVAENDELEFIDEQEALKEHSINLSKDEILYRTFTDAAWYELKRNAQPVGLYHGLGLKIPLGGGFSYRLGAIQNLNPQYSEDYKVVSEGTVFLTNKRIIFQGESQNKTININSLLDIDLYSDSVILGKTTGKKPLIKFDLDDAAVFTRILSRIF